MDKNHITQLVMKSLKNINMAFSSELASMAAITNEEVIDALLKLESEGYAAQRNGYWWLTVSGNKL